MVTWQYGVTTVPQRFKLLAATLKSLSSAGFDKPRLFIDGAADPVHDYPCTVRNPAVGIFGNWALSLQELFIRDPKADRYAIFQDDILICRNVRQYLDKLTMPPRGFWNLYAAMENEKAAQLQAPSLVSGFLPSNQLVRGALALVFSRPAVVELLSSQHFVRKPEDSVRGWRNVDGAVSESLCQCGIEDKWTEYVHLPSLVQHSEEGVRSPTFPERYQGYNYCYYPVAQTFPGQQFDALQLLPS